MRPIYLAALSVVSLVLVAPFAHATDSRRPMPEGPVREATEALRNAQAGEALAKEAKNLKSQSSADYTPKHDDHSGEVLWLLPYVPLGTSPQGFYSFENAADYAQTATISLSGDFGRLLGACAVETVDCKGFLSSGLIV